jgi:hypothetical protein
MIEDCKKNKICRFQNEKLRTKNCQMANFKSAARLLFFSILQVDRSDFSDFSLFVLHDGHC